MKLEGDSNRNLDRGTTPDSEAALTGSTPQASRTPPSSIAPDRFGRYLLLEKLGAGGMGVVYAAYDPNLDRKVALKLLRDDRRERATLCARLEREAKAMARIAHENVLPVYDVGSHDGALFIAMMHVAGGTLRAWRALEPRETRAILKIYMAAGRGLAAAHDAGLLHRDFTPDNVLVDRGDTPRVADFGIAREKAEPARDGDTADVTFGAAAPLTANGALLGTPAYMPPEQLRREPTDARADVFSFAVSLYEALYGERPFDGHTVETQLDAIARGPAEPSTPAVPRRIFRALAPALAFEPGKRTPSMHALLDALSRATRPRRYATLASIAIAVSFAAALAVVYQVNRNVARTALCSGGPARVASVWDASKRRALDAAFHTSSLPYATAVSTLAATTLDEYTAKWSTTYRAACEATRTTGTQSEALLDLRMQCLDDALRAVDAEVSRFVQADDAVVARVGDAIAALPPIARCSDAKALLSTAGPLPNAPKSQLDALRDRSAKLVADDVTGRRKYALEATPALLADIHATGYDALEAESLSTYGRELDTDGQHAAAIAAYHSAAEIASRIGDDRLLARLWSAVGGVHVGLGHVDEGLLWIAYADAAARHSGDATSATLVTLARLEAWAHSGSEELTMGAVQEARSAVARLGEHPVMEARREGDLAVVAGMRGHPEIALPMFEHVLSTMRQAYPPDHPDCQVALVNVIAVKKELSMFADVLAAAAPFEARLREIDPGSFRHGLTLASLAEAELAMGFNEASLRHALESRDILEKVDADDAIMMMLVRSDVGRALLSTGDVAGARATLARAVDDATAGQVAPIDLSASRFDLARARALNGEKPAARRDAEAVLAVVDEAVKKVGGPVYPRQKAEIQAWLDAN